MFRWQDNINVTASLRYCIKNISTTLPYLSETGTGYVLAGPDTNGTCTRTGGGGPAVNPICGGAP